MKTNAVNKKVHKKIPSFGRKDETHNDILERSYNTAVEVQFAQLLTNTQDTIDVNDLPW